MALRYCRRVARKVPQSHPRPPKDLGNGMGVTDPVSGNVVLVPPQLPVVLGARQARSNGSLHACGAISWWIDFGPQEPGS